jgi:hypothetical protein
MKRLAIILLCLGSQSCIPFMSNEQQTALWYSDDERVAMFKRQMDAEIGKELYFESPKQEWCKANRCTTISDSITEYTRKADSSKECLVSWLVDASKSKGNYKYKDGPLYYGMGEKVEWRYVSEPKLCLQTINFNGPW